MGFPLLQFSTITMEEDRLNFDKTIQVVQNQTKINMVENLEKYKIIAKHKA
jgi:hypothetical protein